MIYNNINVLNERTEAGMRMSVAFEKFKKWFIGQEMDTKKIDKAIKEIEACNAKIEQYRKADDKEKDKIRNNLKHNKELVSKQIREMFWIIPASIAMGFTAAVDPIIGLIVVGMYTMLANERLSIDNFYNKIEEENNKALKYLKEEKDVIEFKKSRKDNNKEVQNEGTIFESVSMI